MRLMVTFYLQVPLVVKSDDDVITASSAQPTQNVVPIFTISSVTGEGLDLLTRFLYVLPPSISLKEKERLEQVIIFEYKLCCNVNYYVFYYNRGFWKGSIIGFQNVLQPVYIYVVEI